MADRARKRSEKPEMALSRLGGAAGGDRLGSVRGLLLSLVAYLPLRHEPPTSVFVSTIAVGVILANGVNALFGVKNGAGPKYLTPFQMVDAFGYERGHDGFLFYKIFSQNGEVVQGVYPDDSVLPRLRQHPFRSWVLTERIGHRR